MLSKVFGASSVAISTVVTIFMAGLGIGAYIAGRKADKVKNPLITYGIIEAIVGAWALLVPVLVDPEGWLGTVNGYLHTELGAGSVAFMAARFLCVLPILLVPTTLMGASLPLLARYFVEKSEGSSEVGSWVGALYSVNTFGAVAGVLAGGFLLMPNIGVSLTNTTAACINFFLAAMIFILRRRIDAAYESPKETETSKTNVESETSEPVDADELSKAPTSKSAQAEPEDRAFPNHIRWFAFSAFAISGFSSLCYQIVWSRSLAMTIGSSFQAFNLILATFLIGIGGGSAVASGIMRGKRDLLTAAIASVLLCAFAVIPLAIGAADASDFVASASRRYLLFLALFAAPVILIAVVASSGRIKNAAASAARFMFISPVVAAALSILDDEPTRVAQITAAVTTVLALFFSMLFSLRKRPVVQLAIIPFYIAVAAFVNFVYQDEIPCAFASMVNELDNLPSQVGIVRFFMFLTTMMCTLPATIGMGAMFPATLRIWTAGGGSVGRDVGNVYAGNTIGSVLGAWLPGFVLMQVYGMQRTIIIGMLVYMLLSLVLIVVAAGAEKNETQDGTEGDAEDKLDDQAESDDALTSDTPVLKSPRPDQSPLVTVAIYVIAMTIPAAMGLSIWGGWSDNAPLRWNLEQMTLGVFRVSLAGSACTDDWGKPDLVYYHDGLSTTVSVERWARHIAMKNNGKVDASNGSDMPTQIMVGAYPLLMHEDGPEDLDVAIVGFGSGVTVGSVLDFPVASVDVIELERSIPYASRYFADVNGLEYTLEEFPYVEMDRLNVINDDGRNYLTVTDRTFDVIVSEPSNPWITGVSDLFTTDHFRITKQRLREGGIYCQWVQLYELSPENIKTIYRTFAEAFEYVLVFSAEDLSSDTVLIGSDSPLSLDVARIAAAYELPGVADELERAFVHSPYDVLSRVLIANKEEVLQFSQIERRLVGGAWVDLPESNNVDECGEGCERVPAPLNTDDNALIEFAAPRDLIGYQRFDGYTHRIYSPNWPYGRIEEYVTGLGEDDVLSERAAEMALSLMAHGRKAEAASFVARSDAAGQSPLTLVAAQVLTNLMTGQGEPMARIEVPSPAPQMAETEAELLRQGFAATSAAIGERDYEAAFEAMQSIPTPVRLHSGNSMRYLYAWLLFKTAPIEPSRFDEAIDLFESMIMEDPEYVARHIELYYFLAKSHDAMQNYDKGVRNMRIFVEAEIALAEARAQEELELQQSENSLGDNTTDIQSTDAEEEADAARLAPQDTR